MFLLGKVDCRCAVGDVLAAECLEQTLVVACWLSASQLLQLYVGIDQAIKGLPWIVICVRAASFRPLRITPSIVSSFSLKSETELV